MNVLSLFDGMSCGRIALERLGIQVDNYYASEIDKYAMKVSEANYPDIIQVGDVTQLDTSTLPNIDLVMGGSPCQGFSFAGKQLAFDDPRSALFFEFVRCVNELKPKYFLLENVRMKKEYLDIISEHMGVEPIMINSALVSAQNRVRYYWTNIPGVEQPEQRGIVLRDILETNTSSEYLAGENLQNNYKGGNQLNPNYKSQANTIHDVDGKSGTICAGTHGYANGYVEDFDKPNKIHDIPKDVLKDNERQRRVYGENGKSPTLLARSDSPKVMKTDKPLHVGMAIDIKGYDQIKRVYSEDGKSPTLTTCGGGHREPKVVAGAWRGRYYKDGVRQDHKGSVAGKTKQMLELRKDDKTNTVTTVQKDNVLTKDNVYWRKLTPIECERLQTVPDNYTEGVSNTQRYKMLGNGWTVEVIAHILKNMEIPTEYQVPND